MVDATPDDSAAPPDGPRAPDEQAAEPTVPPVPADLAPERTRRAGVLITGVSALAAFFVMRLLVALNDRQPLAIDHWWSDNIAESSHETLLALAWIPAVGGGTIAMIVIAVVLVAAFLWRRRPWSALTIGLSIAVVVAIGAPMAAVVARVRPEASLAESTATSFPSGHTAVATTVAVSLGLLLRRWWVWTAGAVWVLWMMWSRTYLQAHWLSDVIAGMLEGVAVATLVWCAVEAYRDGHARRKRARAG